MKKYLFLCVLLLACFAETSFAQLQVSNPLAKKEPLLKIPMVHITPVESLFVPVHIDTIKPFFVSLKPIVFGNHENAACEHFKKLKATLVLKGERANNVIANLQWETKYAFYATGFTIEKSLDDSLHFVAVNSAQVSKATNFKIEYHLPDGNDYSGVSFYRIKQHNGDTGFVYSNIVSIKGYDITPFKIYPIPASDKVWVNVLPKQSGNLTILVYDPTGKIAQQQAFSCTKNMHVAQSINISKLAAGVYQLKIFMPDKSFLTGKFIKE
jgi:type IX secretion system substrate protein